MTRKMISACVAIAAMPATAPAAFADGGEFASEAIACKK